MKLKAIFIVVLLFFSFYGCQTAKITTAINLKESGKINEAVETIDQAIDPENEKSEKTIDWPKTWETRGEIYQAIYQSDDEKVKQLSSDPLTVALNSYKKAMELDSKDKLDNSLQIKLTLLTNDLTNQASEAFNNENYTKALKSFEQILIIQNFDLMQEENIAVLDTVIIYNAGLAAYNAGDYKKAVKYYGEAAEHGYNKARSYSLLAQAYQASKDTLGALNALKEGFERYPEDNIVLESMIQIYLDLDKTDEAMKYLDMAISQNDTVPRYYFAKAALYEKLRDEENAIKTYEKTIEIDPDFFNAYYNLGALYYNRGVNQIEIANTVPPNENEKFKAEMAKADEWFTIALPYMEKCYELNPDDIMTLESLKNLYYRLKKMDKYETISEKLENSIG